MSMHGWRALGLLVMVVSVEAPATSPCTNRGEVLRFDFPESVTIDGQPATRGYISEYTTDAGLTVPVPHLNFLSVNVPIDLPPSDVFDEHCETTRADGEAQLAINATYSVVPVQVTP